MSYQFLSLNFLFLLQLFALNFQIPISGNFYFSSTRFYDPKMGRFLKADTAMPHADTRGMNRFAAFNNNPIKFVDPDGHIPQDPAKQRSQKVRSMTHEREAQLRREYRKRRELKALEELGYVGSSGTQEEADNPNEENDLVPFLEDLHSRRDGYHQVHMAAYGTRRVLLPAFSTLHYLPDFDYTPTLVDVQFNARPFKSILLTIDEVDPALSSLMQDVAPYHDLISMPHPHPRNALTHGNNLPVTYAGNPKGDYRIGRAAGRAQIPVETNILGPLLDFDEYPDFVKGYGSGLRLPGFLTVIGGGYGVKAALEHDNLLAKAYALTFALAETASGVATLQSASVLSRTNSSIAMSQAFSVARVAGRVSNVAGGWGFGFDLLNEMGVFDTTIGVDVSAEAARYNDFWHQ